MEGKLATRRQADSTALSPATRQSATVGKEGKGLTYRGYSIYDLAEHSTFEEVAYLLIYGQLPEQAELDEYKAKLRGLRGLPAAAENRSEHNPAQHPSDGCHAHRLLDARHARARRARRTIKSPSPTVLTGIASARCCSTGTSFMTNGTRIDTQTDDDSTAGHLLHLLHGKEPDELHRRAIDVSLILYAEHEFNASTFHGADDRFDPARFLFRGHRRHRRAARAAAWRRQRSGDGVDRTVRNARRGGKGTAGNARGKKLIMGFGHRVYKIPIRART